MSERILKDIQSGFVKVGKHLKVKLLTFVHSTALPTPTLIISPTMSQARTPILLNPDSNPNSSLPLDSDPSHSSSSRLNYKPNPNQKTAPSLRKLKPSYKTKHSLSPTQTQSPAYTPNLTQPTASTSVSSVHPKLQS